jgi:hypothetical protein
VVVVERGLYTSTLNAVSADFAPSYPPDYRTGLGLSSFKPVRSNPSFFAIFFLPQIIFLSSFHASFPACFLCSELEREHF